MQGQVAWPRHTVDARLALGAEQSRDEIPLPPANIGAMAQAEALEAAVLLFKGDLVIALTPALVEEVDNKGQVYHLAVQTAVLRSCPSAWKAPIA